MNDRWARVESIFNKVVEVDSSKRSAVLEESCAGDESLRREVESLLAHHGNADNFIEHPAFEDPGRSQSHSNLLDDAELPQRTDTGQPGLKGSLVAHYRVLEEIGVGGMGIVYKAEDIKLGRPVALKFLPERLAVDSVAVGRFRLEARAASALNHPNICTIYEIEQHDGREFIAMEFLAGQTLAAYISGHAHNSDTVAKLGIPIAEALTAAHSKGVIHRDIKPGNIFVTTSGLVKVLDFGVAKLLQVTDNISTFEVLTETNAITGTLPYMSPEQLRGDDLDARSDIYSLGVVLYEMATGQRPYTSSLHAKLIDEILHRPATPPSTTNRKLPPKLDEIILKCLEKDPEDRYQSAKEIAVDLRRMNTPTSGQVVATKPRGNAWLWAGGAVMTLFIVAAVTWYSLPVRQPRIIGSKQITDDGLALTEAIATDSSRIYFNHGSPDSEINQVSLNGGEVTDFGGTVFAKLPDNSGDRSLYLLDISPDHSQLLAMSGGINGANALLWAVPLPVGSLRRLGDLKADAWGARWSPDMNSLVFTRGSELWLANSDGTQPRRLVAIKGLPLWPSFSPDGKRIRFSILDHDNHTSSLWEVRIDGTDLHQLLPGWHNPPHECCGIWTPDGRYYIFRTTYRNDWTEVFGFGDLYAIAESRSIFHKPASIPLQLTFGPLTYSIGTFTADSKKLLVTATDARPELVRYDLTSKKFVPFPNGGAVWCVAFSHDGKRIAYVKFSDGTLWTSATDGSDRFQLTYPPVRALLPRWSPDGNQIAFMRSQSGKPWKAAVISTQGGTADELSSEGTSEGDPNWSPDGTRIVFANGIGEGLHDIRIIDLKTRRVSPVPGSVGKFSPRWSPNGRYLAALDYSDHPTKLYLFDFRTDKWSDWIADAAGIGYPAWTSDSSYVQYQAQTACKRVRVGENHSQILFTSTNFVNYPTELGVWSDMAPDGSRLFIRDPRARDVYALDMEFP